MVDSPLEIELQNDRVARRSLDPSLSQVTPSQDGVAYQANDFRIPEVVGVNRQVVEEHIQELLMEVPPDVSLPPSVALLDQGQRLLTIQLLPRLDTGGSTLD
jgi:hypothetical protein